jgi:hypothetical protein
MDSCSSGQAPVASSYKYGNELPGSTQKARTVLNSEQQ